MTVEEVPEETGTLASVWINSVTDGLELAWTIGDRVLVADRLLELQNGRGLLALGALLRRLTVEDQIELGAMLCRRVLFGERGN